MWMITLLVMAIAVSLEPFRIGMTVLMLNRPRPMLQLLAFLCGGFAMGMTVGLVVLFVLRPKLPGSTHFTLPKVQIAIGVLALLVAAVLATKVLPRRFDGRRGPVRRSESCRRGYGTCWTPGRGGSRQWQAWGSRCRPLTTWRRWPSSSPRAPRLRRKSADY